VRSAHRRPRLEIYCRVQIRFEGPEEFRLSGRNRSRPRDAFLQFDLINVGGARAENISLELAPDFSYRGGASRLSEKSLFRGSQIPQLAPGQALPLFGFDDRDLWVAGPDGRSGEPKPGFTIAIRYDGPASGPNRLLRWLCALRRRKQFASSFAFVPQNYEGLAMPPAEADD
jgi:hypothetical protein